MAKNNYVIENMKRLQRTINNITPQVYAGIALALHRKCGWGYKRINDLFVESQEIWTECVETEVNMIQMCLDETGIDVQRKVHEKDGTE
jgi:hypothetical protein